MVNELKQLRDADPDFLANANPPKEMDTRHLIFTAVPGDIISIPICGSLDKVLSLQRTDGVTCNECLERLIELSAQGSHASALSFVRGYAAVVLDPDPAIAAQTHGGRPTVEAEKHLEAMDIIRNKALKSADMVAENMIGETSRLYYFNMVNFRVIDEDGDPIQDGLDKIQRMIDGVPEPTPDHNTLFDQ